MTTAMTLTEFADHVGTSARNVRYLLTEEALPPAGDREGRLVFGNDHVRAFQAYSSLLECGLSAKQIGALTSLPEETLGEMSKTLRRIARLKHDARKVPV
jgi:DNA-binding transcriptional MerR regulator